MQPPWLTSTLPVILVGLTLPQRRGPHRATIPHPVCARGRLVHGQGVCAASLPTQLTPLHFGCVQGAVYLFSPVRLCVTPWTARLLCPWNSPGKNPGASCHSLFQGIFPIFPCLLHWQAGSLPRSHLGSPDVCGESVLATVG